LDTIIIRDLAVGYHVGVTEAERATPQKLLLSLEMGIDCGRAAASDDLAQTIDYAAVCQRLLEFGRGRSWKLIETLAVDISDLARDEFRAASVAVEVKKFIIPQAQYVGVRVVR
jgi:dihydroneopterin aldolase